MRKLKSLVPTGVPMPNALSDALILAANLQAKGGAERIAGQYYV